MTTQKTKKISLAGWDRDAAEGCAYLLRPFGLQHSALLVPILGVIAIAAAAIVDLVGNRLAILLDLAIVIPFTMLKIQSGLLTVLVAAAVAGAIFAAQILVIRRRRREG